MSRIAPLEPPYAPEIQSQFDAIMPRGIPPLVLFRTVATSERGDRRDNPQTPCQLVQPEPYRVPIPTNTPAAISVKVLASTSMSGCSNAA